MPSSSFTNKKSLSPPSPAFGFPPAQDAATLRRTNRSGVLLAARRYGPLPRRELADITSLGSATVFSIVNELTSMGLLVEGGLGESTGGRKPTLYRFNPRAFFAVGVEVGELGRLRLVLTDLDGNALARIINQMPADAPPDVLVQSIDFATEEAMGQAGIDRESVRGIGVAMNGRIDITNGVVVFDAYRRWHTVPVPLAQMVTDVTGWPGYVVNQSSAVPLGEKWCGAGRDLDTYVCVNVGVNVGAGMILDGKLYTGSTNLAGQLGHNIVDENGPQCWCGKRGCLGAIAGGEAIVKRVVRDIRLGAESSILARVDGDLELVRTLVVAQAAADGDPYAIQIIQDVGRYLGIGIATLNNLFNPQAVMVAGGIVQAGDVLFDAIKKAAAARSWTELAEVPICPVSLGAEARATGAAIVVLERELTF
jgi:predicted NBD/HSP70 family sugar kinase